MTFTEDFRMDASGVEVLRLSVPPDWNARTNESMALLQQMFRQEDEEGYGSLIKRLRAWTWSHQVPDAHPDHVPLERIAEVAGKVREEADAMVVVGIGGSDLGARTLHDLLDHPYHNILRASGKKNTSPELYFTGDTFDPLRLRGLLEMLEARGMLQRTVINIISKSGVTAETALAGMILADKLGPDWMSRTVATTGLNEKSLLYRWQQSGRGRYLAMFPVPDGVGGRFSFASPVGLFPFAVASEGNPMVRLISAMQGYRDAHEAFLRLPPAQNTAFQIAQILHLAEYGCGKSALIFYPYFDNASLGAWFVQLFAESAQERGRGLNVISTTGPTGNHSLLNGIVNGPRDKFALFLSIADYGSDLAAPKDAPLEGNLEVFRGITMPVAQEASLRGTYEDFLSRGVPSGILYFPTRDAYSIFALMRLLMDAVAVKGRLQSLHIHPHTGERRVSDEETYTQTGVEGYKNRMRDILVH